MAKVGSYITRKELAERLGVTLRTLAKHLPALELAGIIHPQQSPGRGGPLSYDEAEVLKALSDMELMGRVLRNSPRWEHAHRELVKLTLDSPLRDDAGVIRKALLERTPMNETQAMSDQLAAQLREKLAAELEQQIKPILENLRTAGEAIEQFKAAQAELAEAQKNALQFTELQIKWWPEEREAAITTRYRVRYVIFRPNDHEGSMQAFYSDTEGPDARDAIGVVEAFHETDLEDSGQKLLIIGVEWLGNASRDGAERRVTMKIAE